MRWLLSNYDAFNKVVTMTMLLFFMSMYFYAFVTGKHINIQELSGFLIPIVFHGSHLLFNLSSSKATVQAVNQNVSASSLAAVKEVLTGSPVTVTTNGSVHQSGSNEPSN